MFPAMKIEKCITLENSFSYHLTKVLSERKCCHESSPQKMKKQLAAFNKLKPQHSLLCYSLTLSVSQQTFVESALHVSKLTQDYLFYIIVIIIVPTHYNV